MKMAPESLCLCFYFHYFWYINFTIVKSWHSHFWTLVVVKFVGTKVFVIWVDKYWLILLCLCEYVYDLVTLVNVNGSNLGFWNARLVNELLVFKARLIIFFVSTYFELNGRNWRQQCLCCCCTTCESILAGIWINPRQPLGALPCLPPYLPPRVSISICTKIKSVIDQLYSLYILIWIEVLISWNMESKKNCALCILDIRACGWSCVIGGRGGSIRREDCEFQTRFILGSCIHFLQEECRKYGRANWAEFNQRIQTSKVKIFVPKWA